MKKAIVIMIIFLTIFSCEEKMAITNSSNVDDLILGSWYSYTKNYYTEIFIDSVDIYGLYEDIGIIPPVKYKIRNDSLIRYLSSYYDKSYDYNPRIEIVNDSTIRLLYNSDIDSAYLHRLPDFELNVKNIMSIEDENKYLVGFRKRQKVITKNIDLD